jgi:hypothetical protein
MNALDHPVLLLPPARITSPFGWVGHIPFAMLLVELAQPRLLVELGTHSGNSFNAFCQAVDHLELPTRCFAVDSWEGDPHAGAYSDEVYRALQTHVGGRYGRFATLLKMTFDEAKVHFADASIDILHIDGYHTYEAVRHDFENWLPKLSDQAVVLFHDTHVRQADFGVWRFWDELKQRYPAVEFPHSHGLGVLFVGKAIAPQLRVLLDMEPALWLRFQHLTERLGNGVGVTEQLALKDNEIRELAGQIENFRLQIHQLHLDWQASQRKLHEEMQQQLQERETLAQQQLASVQRQLEDTRGEKERLRQHCENLEAQLAAMRQSTSWRLTEPLRSLSAMVSSGSHGAKS